jgi:hypothetical protein
MFLLYVVNLSMQIFNVCSFLPTYIMMQISILDLVTSFNFCTCLVESALEKGA